jgi:hypothetical protein
MNTAVFWVVAPCSLEIDQRFRAIVPMVKAVNQFEAVSFCQTASCDIPEDSHVLFVKGWSPL